GPSPCLMVVTAHQGAVRDVVLVDERTAVSLGADGGLRAWDLVTGSQRWAARTDPERARLAFRAADGELALWTETGAVELWDVRTGTRRAVLATQDTLRGFFFLGGGRAVTIAVDGRVRRWTLGTGASDGSWVAAGPSVSVAI